MARCEFYIGCKNLLIVLWQMYIILRGNSPSFALKSGCSDIIIMPNVYYSSWSVTLIWIYRHGAAPSPPLYLPSILLSDHTVMANTKTKTKQRQIQRQTTASRNFCSYFNISFSMIGNRSGPVILYLIDQLIIFWQSQFISLLVSGQNCNGYLIEDDLHDSAHLPRGLVSFWWCHSCKM